MSRKMHWSVVCLLAAGSAGWGEERAAEPGERILVRLYNPAGVEEREVSGAVAEATWILGKAGIRAEWVRCEGRGLLAGGDPCRETEDAGAVSLGLTAGAPEGMKELALGFTLLQAGGGNHAAVFFGRVKELVKQFPAADRAQVLAAAMAHEIGHVLSASAAHAPRGLMRARWGKEELLRMGQRRLLFGEAERGLMRGRLRAAREARDGQTVLAAVRGQAR